MSMENPFPLDHGSLWMMAVACLLVIGCKKDDVVAPDASGANGSSAVNAVFDIDGNSYPTVTIGTDVWMAFNLRTAHFSNGDPIPYLPAASDWANSDGPAWTAYNGDAAYAALNGDLYNWYAVIDPRNVCPSGWHVATDQDWKQLETAMGMSAAEVEAYGLRGEDSLVGGKLKTEGIWDDPNQGATNESGFGGVPGGYRTQLGGYLQMGTDGLWWSSTAFDSSLAWIRSLSYANAGMGRTHRLKSQGLSVRCVRD